VFLKYNSECRVQLPPPPLNFSRLDIYAPLVKNLRIFLQDHRERRNIFGIDGSWCTLVCRARQSALLPNLRALTLDGKFETFDEAVIWVSAFLSPTIESFYAKQLKISKSGITSSMMSIILQLLSRNCPRLRRLELLANPSNSIEHDERASLLYVALGAPAFYDWQSFRGLQHLVTDVSIITEGSLLSLGQIACLNSLDIYCTKSNDPSSNRLSSYARTFSLSDDSFLSLQRIAIRDLPHEYIILLWGLEPMVRDLKEVEVSMDIAGEYISNEKSNAAWRFASEFIPALADGSPDLTTFIVDFNSANNTGDFLPMILHVETLEPLSVLPLQRVEFYFIHIGARGLDQGALDCRVSALWPKVTLLSLPHQFTYFNSLHNFAALPCLPSGKNGFFITHNSIYFLRFQQIT
jgi:hypothetical protein